MAIILVISHSHLASPVISLTEHVLQSPVVTEAVKIWNMLPVLQGTRTKGPVNSDILRPVFSNLFSISYYGGGPGILRTCHTGATLNF